MKAEELRIGNIVNWQLGKTIKQGIITTVSPPIVVIDHSIKVKDCNLFDVFLTEEWLIKFGFERVQHDVRYFRHGSLRLKTHSKGYFFNYVISRTYIQYVHQLQNLYFALTGEELKINL